MCATVEIGHTWKNGGHTDKAWENGQNGAKTVTGAETLRKRRFLGPKLGKTVVAWPKRWKTAIT